MQVLSILSLLIASGSLALAMPAQNVPENYSQLQPSARALIDATNLICGQYPNRDWVLIGETKVTCPKAQKLTKRADMATNVDAGWIVEYHGVKN